MSSVVRHPELKNTIPATIITHVSQCTPGN